MNKNIIEGKWDEFKGEVRKVWGKITGDEIEATKGDVDSIGGLIEQKYGFKKEEYSDRFTELKDRYTDKAKEALKDSNTPH